jgi:hypothetical protein
MTQPILTLVRSALSKPSAQMVARRQLDDARRQLLVYQSQVEYTTNMVRFYEATIKRLAAYVDDKRS